ncbi:BRCT domain-containing protein [Verrucomicrobiales bacterium]|nr:BRCT domain-containing protein [Verrucomicrobiales bacterium]
MSLEHPDHKEYRHFTKRQIVDKAVHTLTGLLRGVSIDDELNADEIAEVLNWCDQYREVASRAPFSELIPKLDEIMEDQVIDEDELEDLLWLCKNLSPDSEYYDAITNQIQKLQGILHGIMADGHISLEEAKGLQDWINSNEQLKGSYPYDELDSLLMSVLKDGKIDDEEQSLLVGFFEDFIEYSFAKQLKDETRRVKGNLPKLMKLPAVCSNCPEIEFKARRFTFTGTSMKATRNDIADQITKLGGVFAKGLSQKTEFLVVGAGGNPCWAFSCYGRKVEEAVQLRKEGHKIQIIHESDFWDALEDYS